MTGGPGRERPSQNPDKTLAGRASACERARWRSRGDGTPDTGVDRADRGGRTSVRPAAERGMIRRRSAGLRCAKAGDQYYSGVFSQISKPPRSRRLQARRQASLTASTSLRTDETELGRFRRLAARRRVCNSSRAVKFYRAVAEMKDRRRRRSRKIAPRTCLTADVGSHTNECTNGLRRIPTDGNGRSEMQNLQKPRFSRELRRNSERFGG